ncbi:hypothetical protein BGW42_004981 [Actinomortierella wolfii]|nr:hypothetical protein BGW42_004981 [Actinomortierella wolfii]
MQSHFVLGKRLGTGSYGSVHEARWGNQLCAAKAFFVNQSDFHQQSIQKEIRVLQTLRHRHIIQFYRAHEEDGCIYLMMELAEKGSLAQAIKKNEISDWQTKERLAQEIAEGLAFIHQEGILHRDLKSLNVLLTRHMEAKLADFGLAKVRLLSSMASRTNGSTGVTDLDEALAALAIRNGNRETLPEDTPTVYREWVERCWNQDPTQRPEATEVILMQNGSMDVDDGNDGESTANFLDLSFSQSHVAVSQGHRRQVNSGDELMGQAPLGAVGDLENRLAAVDDNDVDLNASDSVKWIFKAASQGDANAQFYLGVRYESGQGIKQSYVEAAKWFTKSALQGNAGSQHNLGNMYKEGRGVEQSYAEAFKWFQMAAGQGLAEAECSLGPLYFEGHGVNKSETEGIRWFIKSANQGYVQAQNCLGTCYFNGLGVEQDYAEAAKWVAKAADQGDARAQNSLGYMYQHGKGVRQSNAEAIRWFTKAADQGYAEAQLRLGLLM